MLSRRWLAVLIFTCIVGGLSLPWLSSRIYQWMIEIRYPNGNGPLFQIPDFSFLLGKWKEIIDNAFWFLFWAGITAWVAYDAIDLYSRRTKPIAQEMTE